MAQIEQGFEQGFLTSILDKNSESLSNVNKFKEILNSPQMHVHHGFAGMNKRGKTSSK